MNATAIDTLLVIVLLLNFFMLAATRLRAVVIAVAIQGVLLGPIYLLAHTGHKVLVHPSPGLIESPSVLRMIVLAALMVAIKGYVIPSLLFRALREIDVRWQVETVIGSIPTLLIGAVGTALAMEYGRTLPLASDHTSNLVVPASLATVWVGFLILTTRRQALAQVLGYLVLENGIFIFGLLLIEAIPMLVEAGVLLDVFVGVFVMGIIIHHVSRAFPSASSEHMRVLRE
jgi:hydrogenase-4 component E